MRGLRRALVLGAVMVGTVGVLTGTASAKLKDTGPFRFVTGTTEFRFDSGGRVDCQAFRVLGDAGEVTHDNSGFVDLEFASCATNSSYSQGVSASMSCTRANLNLTSTSSTTADATLNMTGADCSMHIGGSCHVSVLGLDARFGTLTEGTFADPSADGGADEADLVFGTAGIDDVLYSWSPGNSNCTAYGIDQIGVLGWGKYVSGTPSDMAFVQAQALFELDVDIVNATVDETGPFTFAAGTTQLVLTPTLRVACTTSNVLGDASHWHGGHGFVGLAFAGCSTNLSTPATVSCFPTTDMEIDPATVSTADVVFDLSAGECSLSLTGLTCTVVFPFGTASIENATLTEGTFADPAADGGADEATLVIAAADAEDIPYSASGVACPLVAIPSSSTLDWGSGSSGTPGGMTYRQSTGTDIQIR